MKFEVSEEFAARAIRRRDHLGAIIAAVEEETNELARLGASEKCVALIRTALEFTRNDYNREAAYVARATALLAAGQSVLDEEADIRFDDRMTVHAEIFAHKTEKAKAAT